MKRSALFKDSVWAVSGNGIGNFLMLLSGILIARYLGKDLYGEYGIVKSTMFLAALFATFGLGDTSTKFVAEYLQKDQQDVKGIIIASLKIVLCFSLTICTLLLFFSPQIAEFVHEPRLAVPFRFLGVIIVFRALNTVSAGILGGFKDYKRLGKNNVCGGVIMISVAVPITSMFGLKGALIALLFSQVFLCFANLIAVYKRKKSIIGICKKNHERELIAFSYPFALNEFIYTLTAWGGTLLLTKYSSLGELGMYTACTQWNSIILFMPGLLGNVILSYLSTTAIGDRNTHDSLIRKMLLINFVSTLIPLLLVVVLSPFIARYYGPTFEGMKLVLCISVLGTLFVCLTRVYQSNLISEGKKWLAFKIRSSYNFLNLFVIYVILRLTNGVNAALNLVIAALFIDLLSLFLYMFFYYRGKTKTV